MEFRILGPLEVADGHGAISFDAPKQRTLLAVLLLHANKVVSSERLIDELWGERPPPTATKVVQTYVSQLRKALGPELIVTRPPGYLLRVEDEALDAERFRRLTSEGRAHATNGEQARAGEVYREALALWRGPPLADVVFESFARNEVERLEEERLGVLMDRIDCELELGRHEELVPELETLVEQYPLRERLRAQLMLALYRAGRQAEALGAYQAARRTLVEELGVEPGPALQELQGAILRQEPSLVAAPRPQPTSQLPVPPTPFLGRARELAEIVALLERADLRLLTLIGVGGCGKTRLALRAATEVAPEYPDGVWWVPLAGLRDPALVPASIAQALGIEDEQKLGGRIGERRLLLLLDNFEHVVEAAPALAALLSACPNLNVLATSREPLDLAGEREYLVPALADHEAVHLFRQRAHASEPAEAVLAICRRLDCLPLAVELAAARTKLLPPEALLQRLERRLPLLTGGPRDAPERQRTLEATIAWSYDLLNESERRLFSHLGVFVGGCTLAAAEEVCEADLDTLQSLVDKNLLRCEGERYHMLETIREYATERLAQAGDREEYERRHARHYLERASELYDQRSFFEPHPDRRYAAHAWFIAERENLRAAFAFFTSVGDRQAQLDLGGAAEDIWTAGRVAEGRRVLTQLLEETAGDGSEARRRTLMTARQLAFQQGDLEQALRLADEVLALARSARDARWIIVGLLAVQSLVGELGDLDRARAIAQEGERRAREFEMTNIAVGFMINRAVLEANRGNLAVAEEVLREGLALNAENPGSRGQRALLLLNLGQIALEEGHLPEASALFDEGVHIASEQGDWPSNELVEVAVEGFASIAVEQGEAAAAARLLGAAHAWRQLDNVRLETWERRIHDRTRAAAEELLGTEDFRSVFSAGTKLTLEEAVEYAHAASLVQPDRD
jgi:predicted ATPase/DNA-binding SARP family transcriptional activator